MNKRVVIGIFLLGAIGAGLFVFSGGQERPVKGKRVKTVPVLASTAIQQTVPIYLDGVGTVKARSTVTIKSQIEGQLIEALVHEGQEVRKGDILFRLDSRPLRARLKEAEAELARDKSQLDKALADLKRQTVLSSKGYSPETTRDNAAALVDAAKAAVRVSEVAVEIATLNLEYATIHSPINGRTGSILVSVGNVVKANDTQPLLVITETKPINVSFGVPERYIDVIRERMAGPPVPVEVRTQASDKDFAVGTLFFINNEVDATTGTIELLATVENADEKLVPGQFARARVELSIIENAVMVPSRALQINQQGHFVWVVKGDNSVELQRVTIGPEVDGRTVIAEGLAVGEKVVTDGQLKLFVGAKVELANDAENTNNFKQGGAKPLNGKR